MPEVPLLLLVEDEELIGLLLKEVLEEGGFGVRFVQGAPEAIAALAEDADQFAGLITDVRLESTISGWDVGRKARELRPDMPVVYTSGFAVADWPVNGVPNSIVVAKPFAPAQVLTAISSLVTRAGSQPGAS